MINVEPPRGDDPLVVDKAVELVSISIGLNIRTLQILKDIIKYAPPQVQTDLKSFIEKSDGHVSTMGAMVERLFKP